MFDGLILFPLFFFWLLATAVGAIVFFSRRLRYLSTYLMLGSTATLIGAIGGMACVALAYFHWGPSTQDWSLSALLLSLVCGTGIGAFLGFKAGMKIARRLNRWISWGKEEEAIIRMGIGREND